MPQLLLATNNAGKVAEYRQLLDGSGWQIVTPAEIGLKIAIDETGQTYAENATLKAVAYASASGLTSLADDSGLEVDALDGRPGVLSARYAGADRTDAERAEALLTELRDVADERRTARFRCVIAIASGEDRVELAEGAVEGRIVREPRGESGFGYDPIFLLPERGLTMAELPAGEKHRVSHRGAAAREARVILERWRSDRQP
ncbi:MAG: RdgB/HAM1 family non-canonical purine NTP pyrophosphatase [Chloroflexi bacterium]|nr:RdgB/HAM1 family non-canonical purine NTP pyrophosphatase [Chloroflexota bacterium]